MGWCGRCHAVCVFGDWRGVATLVYSGRGRVTLEVKPCPSPTRTYMDRGYHTVEKCGGPILELPDQEALLAAFLVGGPDAVEVLLTPARLAAVRPPQRW